jgi:hypothetical protein
MREDATTAFPNGRLAAHSSKIGGSFAGFMLASEATTQFIS